MSRNGAFRLVAALLAGSSLVFGPIDAGAQEGWTGTAQTLTMGGTSGEQPRLAFDHLGNGMAIWTRTDTASSAIETLAYRAGGGWGMPPVVISAPGQETMAPRLGIDGAGNVIAIWIRYDGAAFHVQSARYVAAASSWSPAVDIAVVGEGGMGPELEVSAAGDALAIWTQMNGDTAVVQAVRYTAGTGTWGAATVVSDPAGLAYLADVAVAPNGNGLAVWTRDDGVNESVESATYDATAGAWGPPRRVSPLGAFAAYAAVAIDATGNGVAVWQLDGAAQSARYDPVLDDWSKVSILSTGAASGAPALAVDSHGNAVAAWRLSTANQLEAARYLAATRRWQTAAVPNSTDAVAPTVAMDGAGNAVAVWRRSGATSTLQGARFVHATDSWTAAVPLTTTGWSVEQVVAADPSGNFAVLWVGDDGASAAVRTTRWSGAPAAPRITATDTTRGTITMQVTPPVTTEPAFAPTAYEYSIAARPWVRVPVAPAITITGLGIGVWPILLRSVNAAGPGGYTSRTIDVVPDPPSGFVTTSIAGNVVTFTWLPPPDAWPEFSYELEGGVLPGQTLARLPTGSAATTLTATAPPGIYYLRVRTAYYTLRSAPSNELRVVVAVPDPPSAPAHLLGVADGSTLALSWTNTLTGGVPTALWVVVSGGVSGAAPIPIGETFAMTGVPAGTYTLQLVAVNATGASAPSNAVTLTFPGACGGPPEPPAGFVVSASGATVAAVWRPPAAGPALTHYVLSATGSYVGAVATPLRQVSGTLPSGTYTFNVAAANTCGTSAPTAAQTIVVP